MTERSTGRLSPVHSTLLSKAFDRFRSELKDNGEYIGDVDNVEDLLSQARALEPLVSRNSKLSASINRLEPILSHINDFAAIIALYSGANPKATGLVWGSLKVILKLASPAGDALDDLLDMLDELSLSLPRFRSYEETLPMTESLESALLEVYTEMTCFCARTINFFHSHPHRPLIRSGWPKFNGDFTQTIKRLKRLSHTVDVEAEAVRLRANIDKNTELLAAMELMREGSTKKDRLPCYYIPLGVNERFYGRAEILNSIKETLDPQQGGSQCRSLALHGMGGVGKTQIALQYASTSRNIYDAIFWISADNSIKMAQNFLEVGQKLGLTPDNREAQDSFAAMSMVKSWLTETNCRWLLIFDNADDLNILRPAWPSSAVGSILLTSRDFTAGLGAAAGGIHVKPFDDTSGTAAFLWFVGHDPTSESNLSLAKDISRRLGGLPLALKQISGFIMRNKLSLGDFIPLYERNAAKIHAKKSGVTEYEHTLNTVWELAISQLSGPAGSLLRLLAFFDPDKIDEVIITQSSGIEEGTEFAFLIDEMDFLEAEEMLLKAALIDRSAESACLSVHRLVQDTIINGLSTQERTIYFDQAVKLLGGIFPDSWRSGPGYTYSSWNKCEMCLPHVQFVVQQAEKYKLRASEPLNLVQLLLRCSWYLYEAEFYDRARHLVDMTLSIIIDKNSLIYARAENLLGLIYLDTNRPRKALDCFLTGLSIRQNLLDGEDGFVASSLSNVSLAYTELGVFDKSIEYQQKAIDIRSKTNSNMIGNSYSNMASCLLRMGKAEEAEEMLMRCPSLQNMTDESFLRTDNLRFTSDMVLLSSIRQRQGRLDDAIRLCSKALEFRQKTLGNRFKTSDTCYRVAALLHERGDSASALSLLEKCVDISESLPNAEGYLARAKNKMAEIYGSLGKDSELERVLRAEAAALRSRAYLDAASNDKLPDGYDALVPWMLW